MKDRLRALGRLGCTSGLLDLHGPTRISAWCEACWQPFAGMFWGTSATTGDRVWVSLCKDCRRVVDTP